MMISDVQKTAFRRDGFVILDQILDASEVARALDAMARVYSGEFSHDRRPDPEQMPVRDFSAEDNIKHLVHARFLDGDLWDLFTMPRLGAIAAENHHTLLDLAFAWMLAHPQVSSVIAGAMSPEQIRGNVAAAEWKLTEDQLAAIDAISPYADGGISGPEREGGRA